LIREKLGEILSFETSDIASTNQCKYWLINYFIEL